MATTINDQGGRQKILEGLWLIGIDPSQLNVSANLDPNAFLGQLHANGVNDDFIRRAISGVDWRAPGDNSPLSQRVADLLRTSGYRQDEIDTFLSNARQFGGTGTSESASGLLGILTQQFNDRTAGAMMYKATGGKDVRGAVWNPFRTDLPPQNANVNYGSMGQMATQRTQDPNAAQAGTRVPQLGQLPTPPTPAQQARQAGQPAGRPAPPPGPAPGAGGGGAGGGALNVVDNPAAWDDDKIQTFIKQNMGANAWFVDIPEVWNALKNVVKNGKGVAGLEPALEGTQFWRQTAGPARAWYARTHDPSQAADVAADLAQQTEATTAAATSLGITLDPQRAQEISESFLRYGWTQTDLNRALSAEWHYDPSSKQQAVAVTGMKNAAQNWLVPLSDQAIQTWGQGLIAGTTTQDQFNQYLRDNAKSLFPQLASMIDAHAGDPNFDVAHFADPYKQAAADTLGIQPDQVDFNDPSGKWRRALDQIDPATGQRRIMTLSEWQSTLKSDPQYDYDHTQNGVNNAMSLAKSLSSSLGF